MERYNEEELLYLSRQGCPIANKYFYKLYYNYIEIMVKRMQGTIPNYIDTYDIVQETMISCVLAIDNYRPDRYCMLRTYLCTIIKNKIITIFKKMNLENMRLYNSAIFFDAKVDLHENYYYDEIVADNRIQYQPHKRLEREEMMDAYRKEVGVNCSTLERLIFDYQLQGYAHKDIASVLQIDIRAIYNAVYRLQKKMGNLKSI